MKIYSHFSFHLRPKTPSLSHLYSSKPTIPIQQNAQTLQLFSWGRGNSGQLGCGTATSDQIKLYPSPISTLFLPPSSRLSSSISGRLIKSSACDGRPEVGISCGLFHSAVTVEGQCWIWGKGDGGRLGLGHEDCVYVPTLNSYLTNVKCIALGGLHSVCLDSFDQLFTWGYGGFGALGHSVYTRELVPRLVKGPWDQPICHVSTSGTHTAAITESGELYTWGRDEGEGRLGLGPNRGPDQAGGLSIPSKVKDLPVPLSAVSCGGFFTMGLTKEGEIWNWGANSNYELGRGDKIGGWKPQPISSLKYIRIIQIASGGYHSLALSDEGKVFSWGHGGHGQLGHSSIQNQKIPLAIDLIADQRVVYIACGGSSSAAVTDTGKLYMWGNSKDLQLGVPGLRDVQTSPVEVKFLSENDELGNHKVLAVAIGASHSMSLVSHSA